MLLTLATNTFARACGSEGEMTILDLPAYAYNELELRGLNVTAGMLSGWTLEDVDRLRDRADKVGCPCLVLVEDRPLPFGSSKAADRAKAAERVKALGAAAHRLGCNSLAIRCSGKDDDAVFERVAAQVKEIMPPLERMELNLLIGPSKGLTESPDRLTELIKKIGGFRIGSLPDFAHAAATGDLGGTLRKLAPYAGAVHATVLGFKKSGKHEGYDLTACIEAIRSVGFVNTVAIDYRGDDDPKAVVEKAREILQEAIDAE